MILTRGVPGRAKVAQKNGLREAENRLTRLARVLAWA